MTFHSSGWRAAVPVGGAAVAAIVVGVLGPQAQGSTVTSNAQVASVDTVPAAAGALFQYLQDGKYTAFAHEAAAHPSEGQHPVSVIVYFNSVLDASMSAGSAEHPRHAAAVAEVFDQSGTLTGWVVSVKTHTASEGKGWFWYEVRSTTDGDNPTAANWDVPGCIGCHSAGRDYVLSNYPLR